MNKGFVFVLAAAFPLAACSTYDDDYYARVRPASV